MAQDLEKLLQANSAAEAAATKAAAEKAEREANPDSFTLAMRGIEQIPDGRGEKLIGFMMPGVEEAPLPTKLEKVALDYGSARQFYDAAVEFIGRKIVAGDGQDPLANQEKRREYTAVALQVSEAIKPLLEQQQKIREAAGQSIAQESKVRGPGFTRSS